MYACFYYLYYYSKEILKTDENRTGLKKAKQRKQGKTKKMYYTIKILASV